MCAPPPVVQIAADLLSARYVTDLQDPAASAILAADDAVVITASPTFMAQPWLSQHLDVPSSNVYGAELFERNGRCVLTTDAWGMVEILRLPRKESIARARASPFAPHTARSPKRYEPRRGRREVRRCGADAVVLVRAGSRA